MCLEPEKYSINTLQLGQARCRGTLNYLFTFSVKTVKLKVLSQGLTFKNSFILLQLFPLILLFDPIHFLQQIEQKSP